MAIVLGLTWVGGPWGGGVLAPSLGTHCETDPKSGGSESSERGAVTALYP